MTKALKIQRDIIALEAFSITSPSQLLNGFFPSMVKNLTKFVAKLKPASSSVKLNIDKKKLTTQLGAVNFLDVSDTPIQAPDGYLAGKNFKDFSHDLVKASEKLSDIENKLLNPFSVYLGKLISSTEHKFDTSNYFTLLNEFGKNRDTTMVTISSYFGNGGQAKVLGDIFDRNSDMESTVLNLEVASHLMGSVDKEKLNKKVTEIVSYLNVISEKIEKDELGGISKEVVKSLSEGVFQIASELEYFTVIFYHVLAANTTVENISKSIYKV